MFKGQRNFSVRKPIAFPTTVPTKGTTVPVGTVLPWDAAKNKKESREVPYPEDYKACDGEALNPLRFFQLFWKVGYRFGRAGLKFKLPDFSNAMIAEEDSWNKDFWTQGKRTKLIPHSPLNDNDYPRYIFYVIKVK
jgi:hypothetical protein